MASQVYDLEKRTWPTLWWGFYTSGLKLPETGGRSTFVTKFVWPWVNLFSLSKPVSLSVKWGQLYWYSYFAESFWCLGEAAHSEVIHSLDAGARFRGSNPDCCCSVAKSCPTPCNSMHCSMQGFPVLYYLPEFAQTHVHWVSDATVSNPDWTTYYLCVLSHFPLL